MEDAVVAALSKKLNMIDCWERLAKERNVHHDPRMYFLMWGLSFVGRPYEAYRNGCIHAKNHVKGWS